MNTLVTLHHDQPMTTSLAIAEGVVMKHENIIKLVRKYVDDLHEFGTSGFEIQKSEGIAFEMRKSGGRHTEFAWLNEPQATLLMTFLRNSPIVVAFKKALVHAFFDLRDQARATAVAAPAAADGEVQPFVAHHTMMAAATERHFGAWFRIGKMVGLPAPVAMQRAAAITKREIGVDVLLPLQVTAEEIAPPCSADLFILEWMEGALPIPFRPCAFRDLYNCYLRKCDDDGEPQTMSAIKFSQRLRATPDIKVNKKSIKKGDGSHTMTTAVIPVVARKPENSTYQTWLAQEMAAFREAMTGWGR